MTLEDLGYDTGLEQFRLEQGLDTFTAGRVISEHKERYGVRTEEGEFDAELIGNLRFSAESRDDYPAVGDWVAISEYDEDKALIHAIFPRKSIIERQAVGKYGQKQIIATNIDYGLIIQAVDRDFNLNRLERYLTICNASQVSPVIVLTKTDLIHDSELQEILSSVSERINEIPLFALSNYTRSGVDQITAFLQKGKTYCMLGSSGVGKSTLLNNISGEELMKTGAISESVKKGRHITSHRELVVLDKGGIIIDNPGMREVGIADTSDGLEMTFNTITQLAQDCRFKDCTHIHELGCAILEALDNDEIDPDAYNNYQKLQKEKAHFESSLLEKRKKDKEFGKMIKKFKKIRKQDKY